ncbi:MAG: DUF1289 domain-containing protein [Burkholderiaceae bacterium]
MTDDDEVPSPCISICKMDASCGTSEERAAGGLCTGCLRTLDEIIEWGRATPDRKRAIWASIESRRKNNRS